MKRLATLVVLVAVCFTYTWAQKAQPEKRTKELERVDAAQKVLNEIMATPDKSIPSTILTTADCVAVIPSMIKVGFGFGGRYGKGIATCRSTDDHWTAPVPVRIEGGSWGLQFGGQAVDLVMVFANRDGLGQLLNSKFKIGADAGAAAGPVGRDASAGTDWKLRSKILTYSRSRGVFAGVDINGAVLKQDTDDTLALYGDKYVPFSQILAGKVSPPKGTQPFLTEVAKFFREAKAGDVNASKTMPPSGTKEPATSTTARHHGGTAGTATNESSRSESQSGTTGNIGAATGTQSGSQSTTTTTETTSQNQAGTQTSAGSNMSPDQVKSNIQNALKNTPNLDANNVNVDVTSDSVVLSGTVPNDTAKGTVKRIAQDNAGGRKVVDDNLTVK